MHWFTFPFFQGEEDETRETLIKKHFTQRIAELNSQVKSKNLASNVLFFVIVSSFVCVTLHPCPLFSISLVSEPGVYFQKHAEETKLQASTKNKGAGGGVGTILYFSTPLPFCSSSPHISPIFLAHPRHTRLLACLFDVTTWKMGRKRLLALSVSFATLLLIMTQCSSPQASRSVARRLE